MSLDIFRAGLNSILTKTLGMKPGATSPAPILTPEINPGITLESDRPEWKFLADEAIWCTYLELTLQGAATSCAFAIRNPANSGQLAMIEQLEIGSEDSTVCATWGIFIPNDATGWTDNLRVFPTDSRFTPANTTYGGYGPLIASSKNDGSVGFSVAETNHLDTLAIRSQARGLSVDRPIILRPDSMLVVKCFLITALSDVACNFEGRHRKLEPNELVQG